MRAAVNPKLTEEFLLTQEDVLDASVWLDGMTLQAHVTVTPGKELSELALKGVCAAHIGTEQTPDQIILISSSQRD